MILIGAIVIGGLAAFLTLNYVKGVEGESAEKNQMVTVLVAASPLAKGSAADEALASQAIRTAQRRRSELPASAVLRPEDISGQVAAVDFGGGEVITSAMFLTVQDLTGSKGGTIDAGNVAITIMVEPDAGVAGLVQPGDSINIMALGPVAAGTDGATTAALSKASSDPAAPWTLGQPYVYAFQDVKVLGVGKNLGTPVAAAEVAPGAEPAAAAPPAADSNLITVQIPAAQAPLLISLRAAGLYLTLNRPDYEPSPMPFISSLPSFSGEDGRSPYPAASAETAAAAGAAGTTGQ
ncbi:MAG: Flp pilus assembly protein CpaB [Microthrixaceae bacterium]